MNKELTVILPCKNHEKIIIDNFTKLSNFLNKNFDNYEILVISNGSSNENKSLISKLSKEKEILKVIFSNKQGKGRAVKLGLNNARFKNVLIFDSDFSYKVEYISNFFENNFKPLGSFVIGVRDKMKARSRVKKHRYFFGITYNLLFKLLFRIDIQDTQAGIKFINLAEFHQAKKIKSKNFSYDIELILLALASKISISTVDVEAERLENETTIKLFSTPIKMFIELIILRIRYFYIK